MLRFNDLCLYGSPEGTECLPSNIHIFSATQACTFISILQSFSSMQVLIYSDVWTTARGVSGHNVLQEHFVRILRENQISHKI